MPSPTTQATLDLKQSEAPVAVPGYDRSVSFGAVGQPIGWCQPRAMLTVARELLPQRLSIWTINIVERKDIANPAWT